MFELDPGETVKCTLTNTNPLGSDEQWLIAPSVLCVIVEADKR